MKLWDYGPVTSTRSAGLGRLRISDGLAAAMLRENPGFRQASLSDPFEATRETILYMCELVRGSVSDPLVQHTAAVVVLSPFGKGPVSAFGTGSSVLCGSCIINGFSASGGWGMGTSCNY